MKRIKNLRKPSRSINFKDLASPPVLNFSRREIFFWKMHNLRNTFHSKTNNLRKPSRSINFIKRERALRGIIAAKPKLRILTAIITSVIIGLALSTTFSAITVSTSLASAGKVLTSPGLSVYSDSACTTSISSISWGTLTPGETVTQTIYIKNTSSGLSLGLGMTTTSWDPTSANGPITLTWNQQGTDLQPGASVAATLTLTASSSISDVTSFSVQISITGTNP